MDKGLIIFIGLMILMSGVVFVLAEISGATKGEQSVKLYKGWNLVSIYSFDDDKLFDARENSEFINELKEKKIDAIFFYDRYNRRYIQLYPYNINKESQLDSLASNIGDVEQGGDIGEYGAFVNSVIWIHTNKEQIITFTPFDGPLLLKNVNLKSGWNFLTVTPEFQGKTWGELKGSCNIEKAYGWAYGRESWEEIKSSQTFNEADVLWKGIVIKVSSNCNLGSSSDSGNPPNLPIDCQEDDGGKVVSVKGNTIGLNWQGEQVSKTDVCEEDLYENYLREYYCLDNVVQNEGNFCPDGTVCSNGACI